MKNKLRNGIIGLVIAASITSFFTGCGTKPEPFEMPVGPSTAISEVQPNAPDSSSIIGDIGAGTNPGTTDGENDMFATMWYNASSTASAKQELTRFKTDNKLELSEKSMLGGLVDVYTSADGAEYVISGFTPCQIKGGKLSSVQIMTLRLEDSGQRVYVLDSQDDLDGILMSIQGFNNLLEVNNESRPTSIDVRQTLRLDMPMKLASMDKVNTIVAFNGSAIAGRSSFAAGTISIADIADASMGVLMIDSVNVSNRTVTLKVNAAAGSFTVTYQADADGRLSNVVADGKEINKDLDGCLMGFTDDVQLYLTPGAIQSTLGFDVEVYATANAINIVTDEMDVYATDNVVVDSPQAGEAEQGTAGAASEAQTETDYGQNASKPTPPPQAPSKPSGNQGASSKPTTPPASKPDTQKPPASSKPSANDLLNEALGGGSKPSGGGSGGSSSGGGGYLGDGQLGSGTGGGELGSGGTGSLDAWK